MDIRVDVVNQRLQTATNLTSFIAGTQEFIRFVFNLDGDWDGLLIFAQFTQNGQSYNQYLDNDNSAYLPAEIVAGEATLTLYGSYENKKATTDVLTLKIEKNDFTEDGESTEITLSLYQQLATEVHRLSTFTEQFESEYLSGDAALQQQINTKASQADLNSEIARARAAEQANAAALLLKANQSQVDTIASQVDQLANNEVVANAISDAVAEEVATYISNGTIANLTIADGSITRAKVNSSFEATLDKADNSVQIGEQYPTLTTGDSIYLAAKAASDTVQGNLDTVTNEIQDAYTVDETHIYNNLGNAIRGALTQARLYAQTYTQGALIDYKAFTITMVDELPQIGQAMTFYLVPNNSGTGYDKYWWITDETTGLSSWDVFGSSSTLVVTELPQTGDSDVDYILKTNSGCLYYKWIDGMWEVVAGSIAVVSSSLPATGNEYTDYYVLNQSGVYVHYRYINGSFHSIGTETYTSDEIDTLLAGLSGSISTNASNISTNTTNIASLSQTVDGLAQSIRELDLEGNSYYATFGTAEINGVETENVYTLYEVDGEYETIVSQFVIAGGGGGGQQTTTTLTVERVTTSPLVVTPTDTVNLVFTYSSYDGDNEEVDGAYTLKLGSTVVASGSCNFGNNTINVTDLCTIGTQKFVLTVQDDGGNTIVRSWSVQKVDVRLESAFNDRTTYATGSAVNFTYTPYGSVSKTVHFKLDGVDLTSVTTSASGTLQSYSISAQTHGAHLLECWITATINGSTIETDHIVKDIIWYDSTSSVPVIGCIYRCLPVAANATYDENTNYYSKNGTTGLYEFYEGGSAGWSERGQLYYRAVTANQYDSKSIDYVVYNPNTGIPTVTKTIDGSASTLTMDTYYDTITYKGVTSGTHTIDISCGVTTVGIIMDIQELDIDVSPITANLAFDFNPAGYSNTSVNRLWQDNNDNSVAMTVSNNFDWSNGGYQLDDDGNQYFCIKAGTTATFSYNLFGTNPYSTGSHFKLIFKTDNIRDINASWLSCYADSVGLQMKAHQADFKSSAATLEAPYSEGDVIEFEFDIQTLDTEDASADSVIMIYEDGVAYRPLIYNATHRLYQYNPVGITVGSNDCDVMLYRMKAYTASLTDRNVITNFIADAPSAEEMIARYNRNQIYNDNSILTPDSLANACPDLKIIKIDAPKFTNNKSESIGDTTIQCIHKNGDPILDNWTARNCKHSGQGTTSNEYGVAGRNLDLKMNQDDTIIVLGDGTTYSNGTGKVSLTRTSIPNNYFNVKVNIASSENANNALLANRYDRFLPYTTPAKRKDSRTKTTMEFVNCAIFIRENDEDLSTHREFNDTGWHFYGIGNIGDSKKTDKTRVNDSSDTKEFVNEILDNTLATSIFDTGVVNLIVENLPTTGDLFTDYYVENGDGTYTLSRYLNNAWVTVSSTISEIQNGAVSVVSTLPQSGLINIEYYVENLGSYTMYTYDGSAWSTGVSRESITNSHMANSISPLQWVAGNVKYDALYTAESGGKFATNTCEFRYEHKNVSDAQHLANMQVWRDMYAFVITSTDEQFVANYENWFIKESLLYFYLFTERYTMTDNRAKNTFWHWSKFYISETEAAGDYADVAEYYTIDNAKAAINNGYRFDFWDYDNDTALGIECLCQV